MGAVKTLKETIEYQQGYYIGYNEGFSKAMEIFQDEIQLAKASRPVQIIIQTVTDDKEGVNDGKHLHNNERW